MTRRDEQPAAGPIFTIGSLQAASISNVAGDQVIYGGQHGRARFALGEARRDLGLLRDAVEALNLPQPVREAAGRAVQQAEEEMARPEPERGKVAHALEEITGNLTRAGSLVSAGARVVEPLYRLAKWLGPAGQVLLGLLLTAL